MTGTEAWVLGEVVRIGASGGSPPSCRPTTYPSVTLSDEKAPSRSRPPPGPCPAANGALRAADGRPLGGSRRLLASDRSTVRCADAR
jgi:hypothetical protein